MKRYEEEETDQEEMNDGKDLTIIQDQDQEIVIMFVIIVMIWIMKEIKFCDVEYSLVFPCFFLSPVSSHVSSFGVRRCYELVAQKCANFTPTLLCVHTL